MTKASFIDSTTIQIIARDSEKITLKPHMPVLQNNQKEIAEALAFYFEAEFSEDKTSMIYWVLMKMMANSGFSFSYGGSDRSEERERIGERIRELRKAKNMEGRHLALLAGIDAANLSRIESGRYSVGLDILTKISTALGARVDLV